MQLVNNLVEKGLQRDKAASYKIALAIILISLLRKILKSGDLLRP